MANRSALNEYTNQKRFKQMKTMTCNQLGGACNLEFRASTFEEMAGLSQQHGMEMHQAQAPDHLAAMQKMGEFMQSPEKNEPVDGVKKTRI